jgi:hypothetical protein
VAKTRTYIALDPLDHNALEIWATRNRMCRGEAAREIVQRFLRHEMLADIHLCAAVVQRSLGTRLEEVDF